MPDIRATTTEPTTLFASNGPSCTVSKGTELANLDIHQPSDLNVITVPNIRATNVPHNPPPYQTHTSFNPTRNCKSTKAFRKLLIIHSSVFYLLPGLLYELRGLIGVGSEARPNTQSTLISPNPSSILLRSPVLALPPPSLSHCSPQTALAQTLQGRQRIHIRICQCAHACSDMY